MKNSYSPIWFATFLDTIPPEQTRHEIEFLARQLPLPYFRRLLDVCCGSGRHALPLSNHGYHVTGLDNNAEALKRAAQHRNCQYIVGDMRQLPVLACDAAIIMWQSFGYFNAATNAGVLRQIAGILHENGRLILDIYNRAFFEGRSGIRETIRDGNIIQTEQNLQGERLSVRLTYGSGGEDVFEWQVYTPDEINQLGRSVGMQPRLSCANFDEQVAPSSEYPRMQIVFENYSPRNPG